MGESLIMKSMVKRRTTVKRAVKRLASRGRRGRGIADVPGVSTEYQRKLLWWAEAMVKLTALEVAIQQASEAGAVDAAEAENAMGCLVLARANLISGVPTQ